MAKNSVLEKMKKAIGNDDIFVMSDENNPYKVSEYFDTGCYILNAALSDGDIYKGLPVGKRVGIAGPSSVGKSYFIMNIIKRYLDKKENSVAVIFESEGASVIEMADSVGVDKERVLIVPVHSVEDFRTQAIRMLDEIAEQRKEAKKSKSEIPSYIMCLDSLGNLPTEKELRDAREGNDKQDMTRAKIVRSIFRIITLPLSMTNTPLLVSNHSYSTQELYSKQVTSGGEGYKYACDVSGILSKAQDKEGTDRVGSIITFTVDKSRFIPEGQKFKIAISFSKGIYPYSNLIDYAEEFEIIRKEGISFVFKDGTKIKAKELRRNIEQYFTKDIMDELREKIKNKCGFGSIMETEDDFGEDEE